MAFEISSTLLISPIWKVTLLQVKHTHQNSTRSSPVEMPLNNVKDRDLCLASRQELFDNMTAEEATSAHDQV